MNSSLFATMKIVARMIAIDPQLHDAEKAWFAALMNAFGANLRQRRTLNVELSGSGTESLKEIIREITGDKDRSRLLNFLTVAMHTDKSVSASEKAFYTEVKSLLLAMQNSVETDYQSLGKELQLSDRQLMFWKELGNFGNLLNSRSHSPYFFCYPYTSLDAGLLICYLTELFSRSKFKYILLFLTIFLFIFYIAANFRPS